MSIPSTRHTSPRGVEFICSWEGFSSTPYNDGAHPLPGHATIGYGTLLHYGPVTHADRVKYGRGITRAQARALMARELRKTEKQVRSLLGLRVRRRLNQAQFDALVSFAYNCGVGALGSSTLLRLLKSGHPGLAAREFQKWNKAGGVPMLGLTRRREAERQMFLHGKYLNNK